MDDSSSKELLYAEYTGNTVVGHVLEKLELRKKIESFNENKKSATFERVKKFINLIEKEKDESNTLVEIPEQINKETEKSSNSLDTRNGEIEVVMEVNDNSPNSKVDAWFMLKLPKEQESKCSDDNDDELIKNSSTQRILDLSDSSDTSDDELELNFPINANGFALNDSTKFSNNKRKVNTSHSSKVIKNSSNFLIDDSSDTSEEELQQNFPVITNGFMLNGANSTNSSSSEEELNSPSFSKVQDSSNFVNDDSSVSSDVKSEQCLSFNIVKENVNCENSGTLQISLPLKKDKRIFEIPDESSEDLNDEFVRHSSPPLNVKNMFSRKTIKSNFALNDSSNYSLNKCEQNNMFSNKQRLVDDDSDSSNVMTGDSVAESGKLTVNEIELPHHLNNNTSECLHERLMDRKRKLYVEDGIPSICDTESIKKKVTVLDRRVEI